MAGERYVLLTLASSRSRWLAAVTQWANAGAIAADVIKCVSPEELRARLGSSRSFSAAVVDGGLPSLDRDLVDAALTRGCAVVAITSAHGTGRDLRSLGVTATIGDGFTADELFETLRSAAAPVPTSDAEVADQPPPPPASWRGHVAALCGAGGTGVSVAAMALAQTLAGDPRYGGLVLLADLALRADQALLHDARDLTPGVQELVEAHRSRRPTLEMVRDHTFAISERRYRLLLGLRRARAWSSLRPRAFEAAFDSLLQAHRAVVCDTDGDVEGEREGGSADVEERNVMARTAISRANVVFVVGLPGMHGIHALVRTIGEITSFGVASDRIVPVVNRAARRHVARAESAAAVSALLRDGHDGIGRPVFLPERHLEQCVANVRRLPDALGSVLADAFHERLAAASAAPSSAAAPERVAPGSLGTWAEDDEVTR